METKLSEEARALVEIVGKRFGRNAKVLVALIQTLAGNRALRAQQAASLIEMIARNEGVEAQTPLRQRAARVMAYRSRSRRRII